MGEKVQCYRCKDYIPRLRSLIVETPKGKFRLCNDCYALYEQSKSGERYQSAKESVKKFQIKYTDPYEMMKEQEKFLKKLKEGNYGRT